MKENEFVTSVVILSRRLKKDKTYEDFRKAWYHTTGFGVEGRENEGSSNRMFTLVNAFDPSEITVLGFTTTTLEQLEDALNIDVEFRGENPLDDVIEPEIDRKFGLLIAEDDFGAVGQIPYKPPSIGGKKTDLARFYEDLQAIKKLYEDAGKRRDEKTAARAKTKKSA